MTVLKYGAHNTAQNSSDNHSRYPPDNHQSSYVSDGEKK